MNAPADTIALLATVLLVAGCITETKPNKAWGRCKDDPCSDGCPADLREIYCEYYVDDAKCNQCWPPGDAGADSDADGGDGDGVECKRDLDCDMAVPRCTSGDCEPCASDDDCAGRDATPACDTATGACVACTADSQGICAVDGYVCKAGGNECVQCNANDDCPESAPHCGEENECSACVSDADCERWDKVCDEGQCVQCTGNKTQWCSGFVCDSQNRVCATGVLPGAADFCDSCLSDAHCGKSGPALCLPISFAAQDLGYFCQPKLAVGETCIDDHRPYVAAAVDSKQVALESIDGATDASCKLRLTTCQALVEFSSKSCSSPSDDDACGVADLDDGMCVAVPAQSAHRCSIPCLSDDDCKVGSTCGGSGACSL